MLHYIPVIVPIVESQGTRNRASWLLVLVPTLYQTVVFPKSYKRCAQYMIKLLEPLKM